MASKARGPFEGIHLAPKDVMFGLSAAFRADTSTSKVDLGVGAYRDDNALPWVLPSVKKAREIAHQTANLTHEYLPVEGLPEFVALTQQILLGPSSPAIKENRIASIQTISGTGAVNQGARFLARFYPNSPSKKIYTTQPHYVNHFPILNDAGMETGSYPYYSPATKGLDFPAMIAGIRALPDQSILLLHACAHNPTGVDPTREQWKEIAKVMKEKRLLPFFDCAYQGFVSGDLDEDAWAIRYFIEQGFQNMLIAQSFAKNMGLYGERLGCLHVVAPSSDLATNIQSQLQKLQRTNISCPPAYGARIGLQVLQNSQLFEEWKGDLRTIAGRIRSMRAALRERLEGSGEKGKWKHLTDQVGMFCFTGLSEEQVRRLREEWHIYMSTNGRISVSGLNWGNVDYVARALKAVTDGREGKL